MPRLYPQELEYKFRATLRKHLKGKPSSLALVDDIIPVLIEDVPSEAYDLRDPADAGYVFFHGDVSERRVRAQQDRLLSVHLSLKRGVPIGLTLSSYGGDVFAGLAIISTIQRIQREGREVNIHIAGHAMSMGSVIAQVGTRRTIDASGWMMIHEIATDPGYCKTHAIEDEALFLRRLESTIIAFYVQRSGKPESYWRRKWTRRDVYLSAEEALDEGLVDEVVRAQSYRRKRGVVHGSAS